MDSNSEKFVEYSSNSKFSNLLNIKKDEEQIQKDEIPMEIDENFKTNEEENERENLKKNEEENDENLELRKFHILDEISCFSSSPHSNSNSSSSSSSSEIPNEEIEKMLDEAFSNNNKKRTKMEFNNDDENIKNYEENDKAILIEKGLNHFEILPEGWIHVAHNSGMPIYLHKNSRVCTLSKPYFLGPGSARKHEIPLSAIPCLNYKRALEEEEKEKKRGMIDSQNNYSIFTPIFLPQKHLGNNSSKFPSENLDNNPSFSLKHLENRPDFPSDLLNNPCTVKNSIDSANFLPENFNNPTLSLQNPNNPSNNFDNPPDLPQENLENPSIPSTFKTLSNLSETLNNSPYFPSESLKNLPKNPTIFPPENPNFPPTTSNILPKNLNYPPILMPKAKIETVAENSQNTNLKPEQVREYCEKLFKFKTIKVLRFKSWSERRKYSKRKKTEKQLQRPTLPNGTKLITFPIQSMDENCEYGNINNANYNPNNNSTNNINPNRKEWIMNPNGKSFVCILHEYVQHALKKQPSYKFTELENAATPYAASVLINEMQYGLGYGTSKKQAKSEAAKATLEILIPEMKTKLGDEKYGNNGSNNGNNVNNQQLKEEDDEYDLSFFDKIKVEDPRVAEFCAKTTEPSPHDVLLTCLQRNFGLGDIKINYMGNMLNHQNKFTMTVGKHKATVVCKNKRDGKQRASQAILQALHPHINSWGSLLRLYGNRSIKTFKEKKMEEQQITLLQSKASVNSPNFAILEKLREELGKLGEKRRSLRPVGIFVAPSINDLPKLSNSNLKNVDL